MENQHRKIVGYREPTQEDIDLMNRIKAAGKVLLDLQAEVSAKLRDDWHAIGISAGEVLNSRDLIAANSRAALFDRAEPHRWASIAKTDIQTGVMALVRAVAQPTDC